MRIFTILLLAVLFTVGQAQPPIDLQGTERISLWTDHTDAIKTAILPRAPGYAYHSGTFLHEARWPDVGTLLYNSAGSHTSVTSPQLRDAPSLVGAVLHIMNASWSYDSRVVKTHEGDKITFDPLSNDPGTHGWGFWFTGKLIFLDQPGEWHHDGTNVYVHHADPASIDWVTADHVLDSEYNGTGFHVTGVNAQGAKKIAIRVNCGTDNSVRNSRVHKAFEGIVITHHPGVVPSADNSIEGCEVYDCMEAGIVTMGDRTTITHNDVHDIALIPGNAHDNWGAIALASKAGMGNVIAYNRVYNVGYIGIGGGDDCHIHHNVVRDWCMTLNDGSAFTFDNSDGVRIWDNTAIASKVTTFPACPAGYHGCEVRRKGVYKGEGTAKNSSILRNVIVGAQGPGYFGDNSMDSDGDEIAYNYFVNCASGYSHSDWGNRNQPGAPGFPIRKSYRHNVHHNVVFAREGALISQHINAHTPEIDYGISDHNIFYTDVAKPFRRGGVDYSLDEWRDLTGKELNSIMRPYQDPLVLTNEQRVESEMTFTGDWQTVHGEPVTSPVKVPPMTSMVLVRR